MPDGNQIVHPSTTTQSLNLHQRLLAAMRKVQYIQKDREIKMSDEKKKGYMVVTHDAVTAKVRPALLENGVVYFPQNMVSTQNGNRTEIRVDIKFVNADNPADFIEVPTLGYGIDSQDKGPGKALSYAVKMALLKTLSLETGEDADDDTNVEHSAHDPGFITPEQEQTIATLIAETKADTAKFLKFLGCRAIYEIPASQFQQAVNALEAKKKAAT